MQVRGLKDRRGLGDWEDKENDSKFVGLCTDTDYGALQLRIEVYSKWKRIMWISVDGSKNQNMHTWLYN